MKTETKTILFIDEEAFNNKSVIARLEEDAKLKVFYSVSIDETIALINERKVDLIIMEPRMEVTTNILTDDNKKRLGDGSKTGLVLLDWIRKSYPETPVIFYTSLSGDILNHSKIKNSEYLRKPENFETLNGKVQQLLN